MTTEQKRKLQSELQGSVTRLSDEIKRVGYSGQPAEQQPYNYSNPLLNEALHQRDELLAALKHAAGHMEWLIAKGIVVSHGMTNDALDKAKAAIARAEGRQQ